MSKSNSKGRVSGIIMVMLAIIIGVFLIFYNKIFAKKPSGSSAQNNAAKGATLNNIASGVGIKSGNTTISNQVADDAVKGLSSALNSTISGLFSSDDDSSDE